MTLNEFLAMVKDNVGEFAQDFYERREQAPNPDKSFPLDNTQRGWFNNLDVWLHIQAAESELDGMRKRLDDVTESSVEFTMDDFDET